MLWTVLDVLRKVAVGLLVVVPVIAALSGLAVLLSGTVFISILSGITISVISYLVGEELL